MAKEVMMSDMPGGDSGSVGGPGYGGGSAPVSAGAAVAPVTGLGNYKGVMLCNRPKEGGRAGRAEMDANQGPAPFRSTVAATHNDRPGLNPARSEAMEAASRRKPPPKCPVLKRHLKWLKKLQDEMGEQRAENEGRVDAEKAQQDRIKAFCENHRQGVQQMIQEHKDIEQQLQEPVLKKEHRPVNAQKPAWAMTESQSEAAEEYNADELINFAENLDFDQYIHDLEFREALGAIKDRTKLMHKEQEAFKNDLVNSFNVADDEEDAVQSPRPSEGRSAVPAERRSNKAGSEAGETELSHYSTGSAADISKEAMEYNPALKGIHSKASLQKIVEKQQEAEAVA